VAGAAPAAGGASIDLMTAQLQQLMRAGATS